MIWDTPYTVCIAINQRTHVILGRFTSGWPETTLGHVMLDITNCTAYSGKDCPWLKPNTGAATCRYKGVTVDEVSLCLPREQTYEGRILELRAQSLNSQETILFGQVKDRISTLTTRRRRHYRVPDVSSGKWVNLGVSRLDILEETALNRDQSDILHRGLKMFMDHLYIYETDVAGLPFLYVLISQFSTPLACIVSAFSVLLPVAIVSTVANS